MGHNQPPLFYVVDWLASDFPLVGVFFFARWSMSHGCDSGKNASQPLQWTAGAELPRLWPLNRTADRNGPSLMRSLADQFQELQSMHLIYDEHHCSHRCLNSAP